MKELITAVREARTRDVPALLSELDRAGRRSALAELKALRKEVRGWPWEKQDRIRKALLVAGAGCHTGAAGCAAWIGGRDLQVWSRPPYSMLVDVLSDRDPEWLGDVAHRLADRPGTAELFYELISGLVKASQCAVPTSEGFVRGWADALSSSQWQQNRRPLADALRTDPYLTALVPRLFEVAELPSSTLWFDEPDDPSRWHVALALLADEGLLERVPLVDACVARLVRGGKPGELRFFLALLRRLGLTREEEAERVADWTALAADGISTAAGHAQEVLARLDEHGELPVRSLVEVSGSLLFRPEKKLVRAQLVLIGKKLRRDPSAAGELLPVVAEAFGHADIDIQERALKLIARYLPAVDAAVREETALSASLLGPALRTAAAEVFGDLMDAPSAAEPYMELLPSVPVPRRIEPAPATLAELVEELVVLARTASRDSTAFERALDGLVRHARTDRPALTEALRDALAGSWWLVDEPQSRVEHRLRSEAGITLVLAVLLGRVPMEAVQAGRSAWAGSSVCVHAALQGVLKARLWEAADAVLTGSAPFLLALPTWHTGSIDPAVLVERLRTYQQLGARPGEADFAQALLRVRRGVPQEAAAEAAAGLCTPEGDRLAAWLRMDRPLATVHRYDLDRQESTARGWVERQPTDWTRRALMASGENPFIQREFPRSFHWLGSAHTPRHRTCDHWNDQSEPWVATLPEDSETLTAWLLPAMATCVTDDLKHAAQPLLGLVELGGPATEAIHLAVAYALGARYPEDRLSGVDALLMLAAQQRLDAMLLGEQLTLLLDYRLVKPNRLADSARIAAATGAYRTVLSVLAPVLPRLLADKKATTRGLGDLLSVAAECAEHCGAVGGGEPIPGLTETAARGGSSQLVRQAARLRAAWEQGSGRT
ncbi:DUF6493 family protein [Streptomyces gelaticus]|uniref:DUF7824 domain-containing protein n=1 Tax=Streptomyces gelaticus TaxID=285446 RepID=UPI0037A01952